MARLILLNGPPGIGKSTLARRYAADHPLMLVVDIDSLRTSMGGWDTHTESMLLARHLGIAMAETHLRAGHDVIIPQLNGTVGTVAMLAAPAATTGAELHEVVVFGADDPMIRLEARTAELEASGAAHPVLAKPVDRASLMSCVAQLQEVIAE